MVELYTRERKICPICGYFTWKKSITDCPLCEVKLNDLSYSDGKKLMKLNRDETNKLIEKIVGHKIETELVEKRCEYKHKEYLKQKEDHIKREESRINEYQQKYLAEHNIHCPYCNSTNVTKIGTVNRAVSVGMFGLASSKIGKTHKCNDCGSTW